MPHLLEVTKAANERSADVMLRELLGDRLISIDIVVPEVLPHVLVRAHHPSLGSASGRPALHGAPA